MDWWVLSKVPVYSGFLLSAQAPGSGTVSTRTFFCGVSPPTPQSGYSSSHHRCGRDSNCFHPGSCFLSVFGRRGHSDDITHPVAIVSPSSGNQSNVESRKRWKHNKEKRLNRLWNTRKSLIYWKHESNGSPHYYLPTLLIFVFNKNVYSTQAISLILKTYQCSFCFHCA